MALVRFGSAMVRAWNNSSGCSFGSDSSFEEKIVYVLL